MKKNFFIFTFLFAFFCVPAGAQKTAVPFFDEQSAQSDITENEINYPAESISHPPPEEESNHIINIVANAINSAPKNNEMKAAVLEAEALYKRAVSAFKYGKMDESKRFFGLFIQKLGKADIDPGLYFFLFDDFDNIINIQLQPHAKRKAKHELIAAKRGIHI